MVGEEELIPRDLMFVFNGSCDFNPFQFIVYASTEGDARRLLLDQVATCHEFQGCFAETAQNVFRSENLSYRPIHSIEWVSGRTFSDFVLGTTVIMKDPVRILFSSCLDG